MENKSNDLSVQQKQGLEAQNPLQFYMMDLLRGYHPNVSWKHKTFAVRFTSTQYDDVVKTFLVQELTNDRRIVEELSSVGSFRRTDLCRMRDYVDYLKDNGIVTEVDSLVEYTKDIISQAEVQKLFDYLVDEIIVNPESYPDVNKYLVDQSNGINNSGVRADIKGYKGKYRLSDDDAVFGVSPEGLCELFDLSGTRDRRYKEITNGFKCHGFLLNKTNPLDRHVENVDRQIDKKFLVFCIKGYNTRLRQATSVEVVDHE